MARILRQIRNGAVWALAVTLLVLGGPRFVAALVTLPSGPILDKIQNQQHVDKKDINILIASQKRGLNWQQTPRRWTDLGLAQILLAIDRGPGKNRKNQFENADKSLRAGLSMAPSSAFAWTRLAYLDMERGGPSRTAAQKLRMAITRAPYDPRLTFSRLQLSFLAWPYFDKKDRAMIFEQTLFAWNLNARRLVAVAADLGRVGLVRAALLNTSGELLKFESLLEKYRRKTS